MSEDSKRNTKAKFTCWKCEKESPAMTSVNIVIKSFRNAKSMDMPQTFVSEGGREGR